MALTLNFDTPQSATARPVTVIGTVAGRSIGHLTLTLKVTSSSQTQSKNRQFYIEKTYNNSATNNAMSINSSYTLTITPKVLVGIDTVSTLSAWSYDGE